MLPYTVKTVLKPMTVSHPKVSRLGAKPHMATVKTVLKPMTVSHQKVSRLGAKPHMAI